MIHTVLTGLLDTLFPPPDEVLAIRHISKTDFLMNVQRHHYNEVTVLAPYNEPIVRAAIHAHKFYNNRHARTLLAALLTHELTTLSPETYLVPIPLGKARKRSRGYNQVTVLLYDTHRADHVLDDLLVRTHETTEQSHLPRAKRLTNVTGAFTYNKKYKPDLFTNAHFIIIDDVVTTGSTLQEAARTLRQTLPATAKVSCLALAH